MLTVRDELLWVLTMAKTNMRDYVAGMRDVMEQMTKTIKKYEDWIKRLEVALDDR